MTRWSEPAKQKSKGKFRAFLTGFCSVLIIVGAFYSGIQFGNGSWQINIGRQAINENSTLPDKLDYSSVNEIYQALKQNFDGQLDIDKLVAGLKRGLVEASGDPYTAYLDEAEAQVFNEQLNGSFSGIGAELGKQGADVVIIAPISGFPAEKAGLKAGDVIVKIDDQDAIGLSVDEAVTRIRGEKGTTVKLTVIRGQSAEPLEFNIVRDVITIPSVASEVLDGNIGYIRISRFAEDTVSTFNKVAGDLKTSGVRGVVLDLRNNPGGYLSGAVGVAEAWLEDGQLVLEERRAGQVVQTFKANDDGLLLGVPTVVLINEGSASASEIVAGALKDNGVATIIGVTSFGKGSVQEFSTLSAGDVLKVTIARWYTPAGKNIDQAGIEPDIRQELSDEDAKNGKDTQLDAALGILKA